MCVGRRRRPHHGSRHTVWTYRGEAVAAAGIEGVAAVFEVAGGDAHVLGHFGGAPCGASVHVPTLCVDVYGEDAEVRGLPGQRHLAFAFDPHTFARTVLDFTAAHD